MKMKFSVFTSFLFFQKKYEELNRLKWIDLNDMFTALAYLMTTVARSDYTEICSHIEPTITKLKRRSMLMPIN